jgi:hypothetical protein
MTSYVYPNVKSKAELKRRIKEGEQFRVEDQSMFGNKDYSNYTGKILGACGPHYPKPHSWYANLEMVDGKITKVI